MPRALSGRFITFEGIDGGGKTTQVRLLERRLVERGATVVVTREPGGTALGERIRNMILKVGDVTPVPFAELALIFAARAQHVEEVILPALERGATVLCDRFTDATEAYQGGGRGLPAKTVHQLNDLLCRGLKPHLTLIFDLEVRLGLERSMQRLSEARSGESRFEQEGILFLERVRQAYRAIARRESGRCCLIDAARTPEQVSGAVWDAVAAWLAGAAW